MSRTRIELIEQALSNLGALSAGQTAEPEDSAALDSRVDTMLSELSQSEVVTITDPDNIPDALFNVLAEILANISGGKFGKPSDQQARLISENKIRVMVRGRPTGEPLQVDYF